jgi:hypothetical protein
MLIQQGSMLLGKKVGEKPESGEDRQVRLMLMFSFGCLNVCTGADGVGGCAGGKKSVQERNRC